MYNQGKTECDTIRTNCKKSESECNADYATCMRSKGRALCDYNKSNCVNTDKINCNNQYAACIDIIDNVEDTARPDYNKIRVPTYASLFAAALPAGATVDAEYNDIQGGASPNDSSILTHNLSNASVNIRNGLR